MFTVLAAARWRSQWAVSSILRPFLPPPLPSQWQSPRPCRSPGAAHFSACVIMEYEVWKHLTGRQLHLGCVVSKPSRKETCGFHYHLMSKLTWVAWRCSNAICSFPFMLNLQINKSEGVQWLQALWKHNTITRPDGPAATCWHTACPKFPQVHCSSPY